MRPAGIEALTATRCFLEETVLPGVAQEHRSETRAALKILRTLELELAALPRVLHEEIDDLVELCAAVRSSAAPPRPAGRPCARPLPQLHEDHAAARRAAAEAIVALQERARDGDAEAGAHLIDLYATLGRHAEQRLPWQSVFPASSITEGVAR